MHRKEGEKGLEKIVTKEKKGLGSSSRRRRDLQKGIVGKIKGEGRRNKKAYKCLQKNEVREKPKASSRDVPTFNQPTYDMWP